MNDPGPNSPVLHDPEAIVADLAALRRRPPPFDPAPWGCLVALLSVAAIVVLPPLLSSMGTTVAVGPWLPFALGGLALVGAAVGLVGAGFVRGALYAQVREAADTLAREWPDGDPATLRAAAVRVVEGGMVSHGPTTTEGYDPEEMTRRLGDAAGYVRAVERVLVERGSVWPVLTRDEDGAEASAEDAGS